MEVTVAAVGAEEDSHSLGLLMGLYTTQSTMVVQADMGNSMVSPSLIRKLYTLLENLKGHHGNDHKGQRRKLPLLPPSYQVWILTLSCADGLRQVEQKSR